MKIADASARDQSRGSVLVETATSVALLVVILMGVVDLGRFFVAHLNLVRIAAEGARYASSQPGLPESPQFRQSEVVDVIYQMARDMGLPDVPTVSVTYDEVKNTVTVNATANFTPLFPRLISARQVRVRSEVPYLYPAT